MIINSENGEENGPSSSENNCVIQLDEKHDHENLIKYSDINIEFSDICYTPRPNGRSNNGKDVLKLVNGYFRAGCLNVIVGPSGAGKTSLLATICGVKASNVKGTIRINNIPSSPELLRKTICYIPQEFHLMPWMTTNETIYFAVCLKIPKLKGQSLKSVVNEVADKLGLVHCLETMTASLSGGEKKRLSIAVEIVTNPRVLFLDEPTSGLDSSSSSQVISLLKNMAESGCTIVSAIHQPSSHMITMIDEIMILSWGEKLYGGPQNKIIETFKNAGFICPPFYNIGEFVIEVATGQRSGDLELLKKLSQKYKLASLTNSRLMQLDIDDFSGNKEEKLSKKKQQKVSVFVEFKVLLWRAIICIRRDNTMTKLRLAAHIAIGLLLGALFQNFGNDASKIFSNIACLFFFLLFLFFANAMPAVQTFPVEAAVFFREHLNNWYHLGSYYIAKVITDLPLQIINPTVFLSIAYFMTGQPLETERFFKAWLICFLLTILAESIGILAGAAFNTHIGCFLVPAVNIPMILFAGFFLKLNEIPEYMKPLSAISYFRYSFEGFLQAIYYDNKHILHCPTTVCLLQVPEKILAHMDMPSIKYSTIILVLITWIIIIHASIYTVLRWKFINLIK